MPFFYNLNLSNFSFNSNTFSCVKPSCENALKNARNTDVGITKVIYFRSAGTSVDASSYVTFLGSPIASLCQRTSWYLTFNKSSSSKKE